MAIASHNKNDMKKLTVKSVNKFFEDNGFNQKHEPKGLAEASNVVAKHYEIEPIDVLRLVTTEEPIASLNTHSYGFHTAIGRDIIKMFKSNYNYAICNSLANTQFEIDLQNGININGVNSSRGYYNLIVSIRDVKLHKLGIKPRRGFKISDVKKYFGIKGNVFNVLEELENKLEELKREINL